MAAALARTHGTILEQESTETTNFNNYDLKKAMLSVPYNKPAVLKAFGVSGRTSKKSTVRKCSRRFTVINPWTAHETPDSVLKDFGVEMRCHASTNSERFSLPLKELRVFQSENGKDDVYEFIYEAWYYGGSCCAGPNCGSQNKSDNGWSFIDADIELSLNPLLESLSEQDLADKNALKDSEQTLFSKTVTGSKIRRCFKIANNTQDNDLDQSFKFRVSNAPKVSASIEYRERYNRMELNRVKVSMTGQQLREKCKELCPKMRLPFAMLDSEDQLHLEDEFAIDFDSSMDFDTEEDADSETGHFDQFGGRFETQDLTDDDSETELAETETDLTIVGSSTFIFDEEEDEETEQCDQHSITLNLANMKLQSGALLMEEEDSGVWDD
eukprot:TRINITY_DN846_c0_g1_i2.p1 TRINITY_DN846_c0_g1~~TRINITY_DN846_c0_g1_i2.p1  ORF type:complete len:384 (+),score=118.23 TRINITY_DN846_c0_g1_i2:665-1816(+)